MSEENLPKTEDSETNLENEEKPSINSNKDIESSSTAPSGRRQSLRNVRRQLTDNELEQSGTQKLLLEMLEDAENEKENLKNFVSNYYEADKQRAILGEKLYADRSIEVFFGSGVGLGGAIVGLAPFFWELKNWYGFICVGLGICLIIASSIGRIIKK